MKKKTITTRVAYQVQESRNGQWAYRGEWLDKELADARYGQVSQLHHNSVWRVAKVTYKETHEDATP